MLQYTDDQEEQLRPIAIILKTVDGAKKKLDAISEEIEGIEKVYSHTCTLVLFHSQRTLQLQWVRFPFRSKQN